MECPKCEENYKEENPQKIPRILTECGHSFCEVLIKITTINLRIALNHFMTKP